MKKNIKVLLIEDDEDDYILTEDTISEIPGKMYELDWAASYEAGLKAISTNEYDVYLLDYRLGKENGLELLKKMKNQRLNAPLILLTGLGDRELDIEAMEAGAADFLVKADLRPDLLDRSIRYAIQQHKIIGKLRRKEDELQQLNTQLEQKVKERTSELAEAHEELKSILAKERELSELKSRFVSMASHEFKTPLTSIMSSASLIERYTESDHQPKRKKHIDRIKSAVDNLTNILNDFLSLEKIESGSVKSCDSALDLQEAVKDIVDEMAPILKVGQTINFNFKGESKVFMDKHMLKNILINLLSNAIKYSPDEEDIELRIEVTDCIKIEVEDHGIGIPEEDKVHMFQRFFRAGNATNIQGTGLGLTIVKRYLDLMGGSIDFQSEMEKGTTFEVVLPITHKN
jgi:signal transduction histidine kinase